MEASFIEEDALRRLQPDAHPNELGFLDAFDVNRDVICAATAGSVGKLLETAELRGQIARFLHKHKNDANGNER